MDQQELVVERVLTLGRRAVAGGRRVFLARVDARLLRLWSEVFEDFVQIGPVACAERHRQQQRQHYSSRKAAHASHAGSLSLRLRGRATGEGSGRLDETERSAAARPNHRKQPQQSEARPHWNAGRRDPGERRRLHSLGECPCAFVDRIEPHIVELQLVGEEPQIAFSKLRQMLVANGRPCRAVA